MPVFWSKFTCFCLRLCSNLPSVFLKEKNMKTEKEFEETCRMMLEDRWSCNAMPEMSAEVENMFYDNFGMSAEEINDVFCGRKRMD